MSANLSTNVALKVDSENSKLGKMPSTYSSFHNCPDACKLKWADETKTKSGPCYAAHGPGGIHWRLVSDGTHGTTYDEFIAQVSELPDGGIWRHNVAGDLHGENNAIDAKALRTLVKANVGKGGFTYTHKPLTRKAERDAVKFANDNGFTVNLSADSLEEADRKANLGIGPVVVVLPSTQLTNTVTPEGRTVVICPYYANKERTCDKCQLCSRTERAIVGFPAHGCQSKKVDARIERETLLSLV